MPRTTEIRFTDLPAGRALIDALWRIADPENWSDNDCNATFYGHETPKEIAQEALRAVVEGDDSGT